MTKDQFTVAEVITIVIKQLESIPVMGHHVRTMGAALENLDEVLKVLNPMDEKKDGVKDGE